MNIESDEGEPTMVDLVAFALLSPLIVLLILLDAVTKIPMYLGRTDHVRIDDESSLIGRSFIVGTITEDDVVGDPLDDRRHPRVYYMAPDNAEGGFYDYETGSIAHNVASYHAVDVDRAVWWITMFELHEMTHWACVGQGMEYASVENSDGHSNDWADVLEEEMAYVGVDGDTWEMDIGDTNIIDAFDGDVDVLEEALEEEEVEVEYYGVDVANE